MTLKHFTTLFFSVVFNRITYSKGTQFQLQANFNDYYLTEKIKLITIKKMIVFMFNVQKQKKEANISANTVRNICQNADL